METNRRSFLAATAVFGSGSALAAPTTSRPRLQSISAMAFAPDGRLVVADWRQDRLHALDVPLGPAAKEARFNLLDLSDRLARALRRDAASIRVTASAMHPASQSLVLALALGRTADAPIALAVVTGDGSVRRLDPGSLVASSQELASGVQDAALWSRQSSRALLVTDMKFHGAELLVAGLTNTTFDSTLRRIPYPFQGSGARTRVHMYHAVHNQVETRAPVRTFSVVDLDGEPTLLAAYTCTPLVTVPLRDLEDGKTVRGKTIAELGFGNTPLDLVPLTIEYQGRRSDWVLVANAAKSADLISLPDIAAAAKGEGLSTPVAAPFQALAGVKSIALPITNLQRLHDQGPQFVVALRRDPADGMLQLASIRKGAFFRLSDFVNEYDFPSYRYPEGDRFQQDYIRPFHRLMKTDEGHAGLIK